MAAHPTRRAYLHWLRLTLLTLLLAACGPGRSEPTPRSLLPLDAQPTASISGPLPSVVAEGAALPGRLLFAKDGDIWLWQGASGHAITTVGDAFQPAWSPDGTRMAYIQRGESYSDLLVLPAGGGEPVRLTSDGSNNRPHSYERIYDTIWAFYPAFAPDGAEIAFVSQYGPAAGSPAADYHLALYTINATGGAKTQIYADDSGHVGRLAFTPDGTMIVFAFAPAGPGTPQLYRYNRADGSAAPLPDVPEQSYDPAYSPDGRWLAFAARASGRTDLFVLPASGGTPARITSLGTARAPAFSPDGKLLAFLAIMPGANHFDLWVVDLQPSDGALHPGQPRQITRDMGIDADSGVAWGR
jgi:TolB protein